MRKIAFGFFLLFYVCTYAQLQPLTNKNQTAFNTIEQSLSKNDTISGNFQQTRKMKLLSKPLASSGHFTLSKKSGLVWIQTKPFKSTLVVTDNKIEQQFENAPPTIITKAEQPLVFSFTKIFLSIFQGNTKEIQTYFNIAFEGTPANWKIKLTPKSSPLNKAITTIELNGNKKVKQIIINETQDNQMILRFS